MREEEASKLTVEVPVDVPKEPSPSTSEQQLSPGTIAEIEAMTPKSAAEATSKAKKCVQAGDGGGGG